MRWDRLFDDLESQASELEREERDALVGELRDGEWAQTGWRDLLGGHVSLDVRGVGIVSGEIEFVNDKMVHLRAEGADHVVNAHAVAVIHSSERRADATSALGAARGWGQVLRALRDAGEHITVRLVDGSARDGVVDVVGRDFVRLAPPSGRDQVVLLTSIAVVSGRR